MDISLDKNFLLRLQNINWFCNCGNKLNIDIIWRFLSLNNIDEVNLNINNTRWENVSIDAINELTEFLFFNYRQLWNSNIWNVIAIDVRENFLPQFCKKIEYACKKHFGEIYPNIIEDVKWNTANIIMAYTFQDYLKSTFYTELLRIYEAGFLPCGWKSKYPTGRILIY